MDGRTEGWTEGRTYGNSPLCPTGHRPFGAAAQKGRNEVIKEEREEWKEKKEEWKDGKKEGMQERKEGGN